MNNSGNIYGVAHSGRSVSFQFTDPADYIAKKIIDSKVFYESDVLDEIAALGVGEGLFVDVGANIGNHSLFFSVVLNRRVVAFEPVENAYAQLVQNVHLNRVEDSVSCHRVALGAEQGRGCMKIVAGNLGASSFTADQDGNVALATLDSMLYEKNQSIALIKIDVEGLELDVLRGAVKTLKRDAPVLVVEGQTSVAFGKISDFLGELQYVPVSMRGITPTYFFVHQSKLDEFQERSLFYIRNDVDHNRRILQSYLARIESNLRGVLTKVELDKLASTFEAQHKDLIQAVSGSSAPVFRHLDILSGELKAAVAGIVVEQGHRNQLLSEVIEHRFRILSSELATYNEARTKSFDVELRRAEESNNRLAKELRDEAVAHKSSFNEIVADLSKKLESTSVVQARGIDRQEQVFQLLAKSISEEGSKLADSIQEVVRTLDTELIKQEKSSARQYEILERSELSLHAIADKFVVELTSLADVVTRLVDSLSTSIANQASESDARQQASLEKHSQSVKITVENLGKKLRDLDEKISALGGVLSDQVVGVLRDDASRNQELIKRSMGAVHLLSNSVESKMEHVQREISRLGSILAARIEREAKQDLPTLSEKIEQLETQLLNGVSDRMEAFSRASDAIRIENNQILAAKEQELERAFMEERRLQEEVNRLLIAVQTERVRARYVARRLNVLYTSGVRAAVGKVRRLISPLTFGLVKPYETWASFEKRLETRVVREVQDFKKLHANALQRASLRIKSDPPLSSRALPNTLPPAVPQTAASDADSHRDRVRIGIASIEIRRTALSRVIDCLYDQADEILVYLNDYSEIPKFLQRDKIRVVYQQGDVGDRGKFYDVDNFSGYFFTCDDDIEYPPYYVQHCIDAIEKYGRKAVVGWHGSVLKTPFVDYYSPDSRRVFSFRSGRPEDIAVHILGTGCSSFHTDTLKVRYGDFLTANMADVYFALLGQKQRVPFVVIKHDAAEALPLDIPDDKPIHRESMQKTGSRADTREIQNRCVKEWLDWRADKPEPVYSRASHTIAYVGRVDADRWKKGGILKSGGLITQALRALGHRVIDVEISQPFKTISDQAKPADIVWIYPGDPERPDFEPVEALIEQSAKAGKQVYVNLSYNLMESRTHWIRMKLKAWAKSYGNRVKACLFTYAALNEAAFADVRSNLICIPKSIDFSPDIRARFRSTEGIFLGDLQKLLNHKLVNGAIEDWISALRHALPGVKLYAVRQYGGKIDRELGLTVLPYTHGRSWEEWLAAKRIVCCLTPHATYEMIPVEAGGLGVPSVYRPMPQSHSESLSTAGIQVHTPEEFAAACAAIYQDSTLWNMYSSAAIARARSAHIGQVAASLHMQLTLGRA